MYYVLTEPCAMDGRTDATRETPRARRSDDLCDGDRRTGVDRRHAALHVREGAWTHAAVESCAEHETDRYIMKDAEQRSLVNSPHHGPRLYATQI